MPRENAARWDRFKRWIAAAIPSSLQRSAGKFLVKCWQTIVATIHLYTEVDGEQKAAAFAYYVLFALFPLFALLITVGSVFVSSQEITETITNYLPLTLDSQRFIWHSVERLEQARGGVSIISVVIFLWCSLRFFLALVRGVNRAWHTVEIPWWQLPLKNLLMVTITGSALLAGILLPAVLQGIANVLKTFEESVVVHFPQFNFHLVALLLDLSRYAIGWAVLFYAFCMLYMLAPRRPVRFQQVWIAALAVTAALQFCQIAFVAYLPRFVNYGLYGAVGGLMLLLFWVYVLGIIIIFGGCLCAALDKVWGTPTKIDPHPGEQS